jgi:hypothetical protein
VKTGTNAPCSAASANRARIRFGNWNAIVKADIAPLTPKKLAATISRTSPATRERPVANEKKSVERPSRRSRADPSSGGSTSPISGEPGRSSTANGAL